MRKLFIIAVLAFGMNVTAQTTVTGSTLTVQSNTLRANNDVLTLMGERADGSSTRGVTVDANGYITAKGIVLNNGALSDGISGIGTLSAVNLNSTGNANLTSFSASSSTNLNGTVNVNNQVLNANRGLFVNGNTITGVANGAINATSQQAVNGSQLNETNSNLSNLASRVSEVKEEAIDHANNLSEALHNKINDVQQGLSDEIAHQAERIDAAFTSIDLVDKKVDATNAVVTKLDKKVTTEVSRLDSRIDDTNKVVEANKKEAAAATAKVQSNLDAESLARKKADEEIYGSISKTNANLDKEIATRKLEVARLDNRIDNVINYIGNEFKAVNNRIEGLGAMTVALSTAATSSVYNPEKPTNVNFATGYYGRAGALALGVSHFLSPNTKLSVNYAAGSFTKSAVGLGVGFCF